MTKMMCFSSDSVPSGWSEYTPARGKFFRGASVPGGTGGSDTHTHSVSFPSSSTATTETVSVDPGIYPQAFLAHTHTVPAASGLTSSSGSSLPSYREVIAVYYDETFDEES